MSENAQVVLGEFAARIIGKKVGFTRLAANSLIVYIDCEPPAETGFSLWFEPTWHIGCRKGVLLGSRQAQAEDESTHAELGSLAGQLVGKNVESIEINSITHDIRVRFTEAYWVSSFVSDPADEDIWDIRDNSKKLAVVATPTRYFLREIQRFTASDKK
jgi:hypothetical protein